MIRIQIVLILILFSFKTVHAQQEPRTSFDTAAVPGIKVPYNLKPSGWVNDYEKILSKAQIIILDSMISNFEKQTSIEIAIVTLDTSYVTKENFDTLITSLGNSWGVGKQGKDNGVIIGVSSGYRRIRISNGYGIEAKLTDAETKKIIDEKIFPEFKKQHYFEGLKKGLLAIMTIVK